jgi:hypothetical protein
MSAAAFFLTSAKHNSSAIAGPGSANISEQGSPIPVYDGAMGGVRAGTALADLQYGVEIDAQDTATAPTLGASGDLELKGKPVSNGTVAGTEVTLTITGAVCVAVNKSLDHTGNSRVRASFIAPKPYPTGT